MLDDRVRFTAQSPGVAVVPTGQDEGQVFWELVRVVDGDAFKDFGEEELVADGGKVQA
jgi:hypothetical protein